MKLLILAQTPPPVHGQSLMVQTLVTGLPERGLDVHHVNLGLSRNAADIGRWQGGKIAAVFDACIHTLLTRFTHGCDTLYYVPAPGGKRGALYRDWIVMMLCRPFFKRLVLHWHAAGLGEWLATRASGPERWLTHRLLGKADLSIVLGKALHPDAEGLHSRRIIMIRNGIEDPCVDFVRPSTPSERIRTAVFLGLVSPEKGVLDAIDAVRLTNTTASYGNWRLILAGDIPDHAFADRINRLIRESGGTLSYAGFVQGADKHQLLMAADALVFPTYYSAETQGLVVAEALAYDLPVIVTRWRSVAEDLPTATTYLVEPHEPGEIAASLARIARAHFPPGVARRHFLAHYTLTHHLDAMTTALASLDG